MMPLLDSSILNEITFEVISEEVNPKIRVATVTSELRIIGQAISATAGISTRRWLRIARSIVDHEGYGANDFGYRYPTDELDPSEEPFEGVLVYALDDAVLVDVVAWDNLMLRFLRTAAEAARSRSDKSIQSGWWPEFMHSIEAIELRCAELDVTKSEEMRADKRPGL